MTAEEKRYCAGCEYLEKTGKETTCDFMIETGRRRGCPVGAGCPHHTAIPQEAAHRKQAGGRPAAPLDELRLMELYRDGADDLTMAEACGCSVRTIRRWRGRMHLKRKSGPKKREADGGGGSSQAPTPTEGAEGTAGGHAGPPLREDEEGADNHQSPAASDAGTVSTGSRYEVEIANGCYPLTYRCGSINKALGCLCQARENTFRVGFATDALMERLVDLKRGVIREIAGDGFCVREVRNEA